MVLRLIDVSMENDSPKKINYSGLLFVFVCPASRILTDSISDQREVIIKGAPGSKCRTSTRLVSPAGGREKKKKTSPEQAFGTSF